MSHTRELYPQHQIILPVPIIKPVFATVISSTALSVFPSPDPTCW